MKRKILNLRRQNGTLSMIIQTQLNAANEITYNTQVLKSSICDYNDAYNLVRDEITVIAASETQVTFRNCASFIKYITILME